MWKRWVVLSSFLLGGVLASGLAPPGARALRAQNEVSQVTGEQLKPLWQVGDQWVVETQSLLLQRRSDQTEQRGPAVQWQFSVQGVEKIGDAETLKVGVQCLLPGRMQPVTTLWVDQQSMTLRRMQTQLPVGGEFRTVSETYQADSGQPSAVLAPLTALPLDLPHFVGGQVKGKQVYTYDAISGPPEAKDPGEVAFAFEVEQEVSTAQPEEVKSLLKMPPAKNVNAQEFAEIHLKTAGREVRQIWQAGQPWPVYADNGSTVARLVKVTRAN